MLESWLGERSLPKPQSRAAPAAATLCVCVCARVCGRFFFFNFYFWFTSENFAVRHAEPAGGRRQPRMVLVANGNC